MKSMTSHARAGFTLVELVIVVAILGVVASVGGLAFARLARADQSAPDTMARMREARRDALRRGMAVTMTDSAPGRAPWHATAYPDGRVVADSALGIDVLTGAAAERAR